MRKLVIALAILFLPTLAIARGGGGVVAAAAAMVAAELAAMARGSRAHVRRRLERPLGIVFPVVPA